MCRPFRRSTSTRSTQPLYWHTARHWLPLTSIFPTFRQSVGTSTSRTALPHTLNLLVVRHNGVTTCLFFFSQLARQAGTILLHQALADSFFSSFGFSEVPKGQLRTRRLVSSSRLPLQSWAQRFLDCTSLRRGPEPSSFPGSR